MWHLRANSSRTSTTCARSAPVASARSRISSSTSLPCPRSIVTAMISAPCRSASQGMAMDVSRFPQFAVTIRCTAGSPAWFVIFRRVVLEPLDERGGAARAARDHENRVVAGDRADRLGQPRAIERLGQRLRLAAAGPDDDELLDAFDALRGTSASVRSSAIEHFGALRGLSGVGPGALLSARDP